MLRLRKIALWFSLFAQCYSLYEDQVGKFDWRQRYVGKVIFSAWEQSKHSGKRFLVGTDQNVIASLNAQTGDIAWRQLLESDVRGRIDAFLHHGNVLITLSGNGHSLRSWNPSTGLLLWDVTTSDEETSSRGAAVLSGPDKGKVAVVSGTSLACYSASNGRQEWQTGLPHTDISVYQHVLEVKGQLTVVGVAEGSHVTVVKYNSDGVQSSHRSVPASWITLTTRCVVIGQKYLTCYRSGSQSLQYLQLDNGQAFLSTSLESLGVSPQGEAVYPEVISADHSSPELKLHLTDHVIVLRIKDDSVKVVKDLPKFSTCLLVTYDDKTVLLATQRVSIEKVKLMAFDVETGGELVEFSHDLHVASFHGNPLQIEAIFFKKKDGRWGYRSVLMYEDYSVHLVQSTGKIAWRREEALSYILSVEMVDLPVSESEAKFEDEFGSQHDDIIGMFRKRFTTQLVQLKSFVLGLIQKLQGYRDRSHSLIIETEDEEEAEIELTRDQFNLNKIVVVVTAAGKIYGLRSTNGQIIWQHYLPDLTPFERYGKQVLPLSIQRTTAHFPHPPQCAIVGRHKKTGRGLLYVLNPVTGQRLKDMPPGGQSLGFTVIQMDMLNEVDEHFLKGLIFMDEEKKIHTYPSHFRQIVARHSTSLFMYLVEPEKGLLSGYRVDGSETCLPDLYGDPVWAVNLQQKSQTITNVVPRRAIEHVHSQGRVLGDRSVLYKYLNPNVVVVTAEGEETTSVTQASSAQKGPSYFLNVYLIDVITGHIVSHVNHKRVKGPVHVVHSENWVVYNYWNQKNRRIEMSVLELFEGKEQSNSTSFSSYNPPPQPLILRQSYIFSSPISTMAATITEKGITNRNVLIALKSGGILSLPKAFLDPRRPVVPTPEHMEEGTFPYMPEIPSSFEAVVNYNRSVHNIRHIHTAPAGLESTCVFLAYGIDLFYTRVMPSKMFDVLKEDFDYFFISSVLIGMIVVSVITQKLAARKALNRAWK
ncbi:ER membrane protein complex subunit 1-like [Liolophura sinensis]|uniref:ER membrane protein complex subunit 1-like n=1 Tax=Liolophura sinensis TaxID=3198878 RepID=UPI0031596A55